MVLGLTTVKQFMPWSTKKAQTMGISNESQKIPISKCISFGLGPYSSLAKIFREVSWKNLLLPKGGGIILDTDSNHQSNPPVELNGHLTSFICSTSDGARADFGKTNNLSLLNQLSLSLQT